MDVQLNFINGLRRRKSSQKMLTTPFCASFVSVFWVTSWGGSGRLLALVMRKGTTKPPRLMCGLGLEDLSGLSSITSTIRRMWLLDSLEEKAPGLREGKTSLREHTDQILLEKIPLDLITNSCETKNFAYPPTPCDTPLYNVSKMQAPFGRPVEI